MMKIMNNHLQIISFLQTFQISVPQKAVDSVNTVSMPAKTIGYQVLLILETHLIVS